MRAEVDTRTPQDIQSLSHTFSRSSKTLARRTQDGPSRFQNGSSRLQSDTRRSTSKLLQITKSPNSKKRLVAVLPKRLRLTGQISSWNDKRLNRKRRTKIHSLSIWARPYAPRVMGSKSQPAPRHRRRPQPASAAMHPKRHLPKRIMAMLHKFLLRNQCRRGRASREASHQFVIRRSLRPH